MSIAWRAAFPAVIALQVCGCADILCENTVVRRVNSPDGRMQAVAFLRDCGATAAASLQVSVMQSAAVLPNEPGNVYRQRYDQPVNLRWAASRELHLEHDPDVAPLRTVARHEGVDIRYFAAPLPDRTVGP